MADHSGVRLKRLKFSFDLLFVELLKYGKHFFGISAALIVIFTCANYRKEVIKRLVCSEKICFNQCMFTSKFSGYAYLSDHQGLAKKFEHFPS